METYRALRIAEQDGQFVRQIERLPVPELKTGEIQIRVSWSSVNYKDALSSIGNRGVTRRSTRTPRASMPPARCRRPVTAVSRRNGGAGHRVRPRHEYRRRLWRGHHRAGRLGGAAAGRPVRSGMSWPSGRRALRRRWPSKPLPGLSGRRTARCW